MSFKVINERAERTAIVCDECGHRYISEAGAREEELRGFVLAKKLMFQFDGKDFCTTKKKGCGR